MPAERGDWTTVLSASSQKASVNTRVLTGCPGIRRPVADRAAVPSRSRRRKTRSAAPVRPKKSASMATT